MNYNGSQIIDAIVRRLNDEDIRCHDSAIIQKLASLDRYEINQLTTFGDIDKWIADRNKVKGPINYSLHFINKELKS